MLVSGTAAKAEEMVTLQEFLRTHPPLEDDNSRLYVFYRCTSLMTMMTALTPKDKVAMEEMLETKALNFLAVTIKLQSKVSGGKSQEEATKIVIKTLEPFAEKYSEAANKNYFNRGNYFGGSSLLEGDLKICAKFKF